MVGSDFGGGVANDPTRQDWLGVGLAMTSVIMLSTYMVLVRRTVTNRYQHQRRGITVGAVGQHYRRSQGP